MKLFLFPRSWVCRGDIGALHRSKVVLLHSFWVLSSVAPSYLALAQDPTCAKLSISGEMQKVPSEQLDEAEELLFSRHPAMKDWPADHKFEM